MQKVKLLYNPISGDTTFPRKLDTVIAKFQATGYQIIPYRSMTQGDIHKGIADIDESYAFVLAAGGDGTIHEVINAMMTCQLDLPVGIFPTGTSNDFARHLRMPYNIETCCNMILQQNIRRGDIGKVNDDYFINVASGGLFTDVSQAVDVRFKNNLGRLAYYLKGIERLPALKSFRLCFKHDQACLEEEIYLFLVLNGSTICGLDNLLRHGSVYDGYFDVLIFRACPLPRLANIFLKILRGGHLNDPYVTYFRTNHLQVTLLDDDVFPTDVDGEKSPPCPLDITLLPKQIRFFTPN